jgi:hypothetical protein
VIEEELIFVFDNCIFEHQNLSSAAISSWIFCGEWLCVLLAVLLGNMNLGFCVD